MPDLATWPVALPSPDIQFTGQTAVAAIRLDMESGKSRQRRRFSEDLMTLNVQWTLTTAEANFLRAFLKFKLNDGVDQFNMPLIIGGGVRNQVVRFIDGKCNFQYQESGNYLVTAQLEQIFNAGYCTPNLTGFLTVPLGDVDLSAYFGVVVASPFVADAWRLHTDDCGFNIQYFIGAINPDGTLNPGVSNVGNPEAVGWHSDTLKFHSVYPYAEGIYLQVNCGGLWSSMPCIAGGNGSPD